MKKNNLDQLIAQGYDFDIEKSFNRGWEMFKVKPFYSMAYATLILSMQFMFVLYLKDLAVLFSIFLAGPLYAGFFLVANKISRNEEVIYPDFFSGFQYYIPVILVWVVGQTLTVLGMVLLIFPGIYLLVGYIFAMLMAIFGGLDFWNALEYSRKLIHLKWWKFLLLTLILILLNIIGVLLFIIGLIVTIPLTCYIIYSLFEEITEEALMEE
ncbi:MAG: hypothetical protein WD426_02775 [Anditalea sp.]